MKKLIFLFLFNLLIYSGFAQVHVNGYYRSNGTYVQPHMRSSPDGNPYNNWSYPGNVNPYTGKVATGNPDTYLDRYYNRNTYSSSPSSTTYPGTYYPSSTYPNNDDYIRHTGAYVTAQKLNVRLSANSSSPVVAVLNYQTQVEVLDRSLSPWYYVTVKYNDQTYGFPRIAMGYVHSDYLAYSEPISSYNITPSSRNTDQDSIGHYFVAISRLNVHVSPSMKSDILTQLTFKDGVTILSASDYPWYRIHISYLNSSGNFQNTSYAYAYGPDLTTEVPRYVRSPATDGTKSLSNENSTAAHPYGFNDGKINFWSNVPNEHISIYFDYGHVGELTNYFSGQPSGCGGEGIISLVETQGRHLVQAIGQTYHWSGYVTIHADQCDMFKIGTNPQ